LLKSSLKSFEFQGNVLKVNSLTKILDVNSCSNFYSTKENKKVDHLVEI